jgi:hypothetical protein
MCGKLQSSLQLLLHTGCIIVTSSQTHMVEMKVAIVSQRKHEAKAKMHYPRALQVGSTQAVEANMS